MKWRDKAACIGAPSDVFFPHDTLANNRWEAALAYCRVCPVKGECLEMVLKLEDHEDKWGMFGGMTPGERRVIRDYRRRNG